ncbi:polysaccharide deacetylase family protein [Streptomyces sp. NPDC052101]|uniref:polysaccharide deacetylase family protein n=1 Tax=Streptomyces sp. NPDC052101 TaxID=3155763 RepID=UPI0034399DCB
MYDNAGDPVTYRLQAVELVPDTSSVFPKGLVSLTFDDSHASLHDLARPVMDAYGFPGTNYNIADAIGADGCLTIGKVRSLQDRSGWEMAGHACATSAHAASYGRLTAQQVDDDLRRLREWLVSNGFGGTTLSKLTAAGGALDRCAVNGDWLIICLHRVVAGRPSSNTEISQRGLAALVKAVSDRGIPRGDGRGGDGVLRIARTDSRGSVPKASQSRGFQGDSWSAAGTGGGLPGQEVLDGAEPVADFGGGCGVAWRGAQGRGRRTRRGCRDGPGRAVRGCRADGR